MRPSSLPARGALPHLPEGVTVNGRPRLWHYGCWHTYASVGSRGHLIAPPFPAEGVAETYGEAYAWFDREDRPVWLTSGDFATTGIDGHGTACDRSAYRYLVMAPELCEPWLASRDRHEAPAKLVRWLEQRGDPAAWWIGRGPIPARLA